MNEEEKKLASIGVLSPWLLYNAQRHVYTHQHTHRFPFCEMNRRFGKTFTTFVRLHEVLIRNEGWVARWCEPLKNQCREILQPEIEKISAMIPEHQRPIWHQTDSYYEYPNRSKIYLRGVNEDKGESARGSFSNIIVLDELGSYNDTAYIVNEVLMPQLLTTRGQMIVIGTPPRKMDHEYYKMKERAIQSGTFIQKTIEDCKWFTRPEVSAMCLAVGGKDSSAWRREFMCEPVTDEKSLVIPEFKESTHVFDSMPLPAHFDVYVAMDAGFHDHTSVLLAAYDFLRRKVLVVDEIWVNKKNSSEISNLIDAMVKTHFPKVTPYRYIADAPAQVIYDLNSLHRLPFVPPLKDDKFAAINNVRIMVGDGKIEIHRRCANLIFQLRAGMWNEAGKDFQRSDTLGHLDAIAALVYLCRSIDWTKNPYPRIAEDATRASHWINEMPGAESQLSNAIFPFTKRG